MAVWLVRAGMDQDLEDLALREGLAVVGFPGAPDLRGIDSAEALGRILAGSGSRREERRARLRATQLWSFRDRLQVGDLVLLPMSSRRRVALGEILGPYKHRPDLPEGARHTRRVRWHRASLAYDDLGPELRRSLSVGRTICRLRRPEAEREIEALLAREAPDPLEESCTEATLISSEPLLQSTYPLSDCADDTGFLEAELARYVRAIDRKGQAILIGPPGTGKTFLADRLARHLVGGGDGFVDLIQFHPAYDYRNFIQGTSLEGPSGRFVRFCQEAARCSGLCALLIDEVNRADSLRVFGELIYLLEHRGRSICLAEGGSLSIPFNVRILGTMNTADRTLSLTDHVLRRRFAFIRLGPKYGVISHFHERSQSGFDPDGLIDVLKEVNRQIGHAHFALGHTYFLRVDLAEQVEDIWRMEVEPYLEEVFFDRPERAALFSWSRVRSAILG